MNEKMTDEELSLILARIRTELGHTAESDLSAHIAALTAERDSEKAAHRLTAEGWWADARLWNGERDALRERVQALEAELERVRDIVREYRELIRSARCERNAASTRLAVIRQPVREAMDLLGESSDNATKAWRLLNAALDDARPSAPPEAFTHEKGLDAGVFDEAPEETKADRLMREEREAAAEMVRHAAEPTTSEAFATVREAVAIARDNVSTPTGILAMTTAEHALSLLERRMGAILARSSAVLTTWERCGSASEAHGVAVEHLRAALTDAPPVFTLEDVERKSADLKRLMTLEAMWSDGEWRSAAAAFFSALRGAP